MLKYVYIDESGDLGLSNASSNFLVLSALVVNDPALLDRIIKNMRRHKFKKELHKAQEIKANNSSPDVRKFMLLKLNTVPQTQVFHVVLDKKKIYSEYLKGDKNKLYNFVSGKLAQNIPLQCDTVEVRIDRSKGKQLLREDFNEYFERKLREKSSFRKVVIQHSYSHSWSGLQFADLLAWSAFQKVCRKNPEYSDLLTIPQEVYQIW